MKAFFSILAILLITIFFTFQSAEAMHSYDHCILVNMKGVQSDVAAKAIKRSCLNMIDRREKEKAKAEKKKAENPEFPLSSKQRGKLSGSGAPNYTLWTGSIYNGNTDIEIISITLAVTIK